MYKLYSVREKKTYLKRDVQRILYSDSEQSVATATSKTPFMEAPLAFILSSHWILFLGVHQRLNYLFLSRRCLPIILWR